MSTEEMNMQELESQVNEQERLRREKLVQLQQKQELDRLQLIKTSYYKMKEDIVKNLMATQDINNLSDNDLKDLISKSIATHEDRKVLDKYTENKDKLINYLKTMILKY